MKLTPMIAALLLTSGALVQAAPSPYLTIDHSSETLIDAATASAMWKGHQSAKLTRMYPSKKWGFASQVEGGFTDSKVCVVTARAMMLPRSGKSLVFRPAKTATAFAALPDATAQQCKALAKTKLGEAVDAMESALMAP